MEQTIQSYNQIFWDIVKKYDLNETNLFRKFIHSFDVAKNCFTIACNKKMNENERNMCYLMGLFHDIGRFKQWVKYKTYDDVKSEDHGELSYSMLCDMDCLSIFGLNKKELNTIKEAIRYHTKPYLGKDVDIKKYNAILNDADAYANVVTVANGMQQMTVNKDGYTEEILTAFNNRKLLRIFSPKTKLDRCLILTASCYYIKNKQIRVDILESNYIDVIYQTFSKYLNKEDKKIYKEALENLKEDYVR